ncbi:MAG: GNAT family N-acetyltransferase [Candidatus Promineifilaceae bacterium]
MAQFVLVSPRPADTDALRRELTAIYTAAFGPPPYSHTAREARYFSQRYPGHAARPGFRLRLARQAPHGAPAGFAYGYPSRPGQWWHDQVRPHLESGPAAVWLADAFELVELAVAPAFQGLGLGGRLHDALLAGLTCRRALLSTLAQPTRALAMYRRRGWQTLVESMHFDGVPEPYRVMGKLLPAKAGQPEPPGA